MFLLTPSFHLPPSILSIAILSALNPTSSFASDNSLTENFKPYYNSISRISISNDFIDQDELSESRTHGLSANGSVAVGRISINNGYLRAFIWTPDAGLHTLGTLKADNTGYSVAYAVSADGKTVVGAATTDIGAGNFHAYIWTAETGMTGLGTLKADNTGYSLALAISDNGNVVAGMSSIDGNTSHQAFIWTAADGMSGLGSLRTDGQGESTADAISSDGSIVSGRSTTDSGDTQAFIWNSVKGMESLGTLKADNSGYSGAYALSADGRVAAGGAESDNGRNAFIWTEATGMINLGSLHSDNSGNSAVYDLSADGRIAVGNSTNDIGITNGFVWRADTGMLALAADDVYSSANAISSDGSVVSGSIDSRATLWKIDWSSTENPGREVVDVENARQARLNLANDTFQLLEMQRSTLNNLRNPCSVYSQNEICLRVGTDYQTSNHTDDMTTSFSIGYGLTDSLSAGLNLATYLAGNLPDSYTHSSNNFAAGAWSNWRQQDEYGSWYATISGSIASARMNTSTSGLGNADIGKGDVDTQGWSASVEAGRNMIISPNLGVQLSGGISHDALSRDSYSESNSAFPFSYDTVRYRTTYAFVSAGAEVTLTPNLRWISKVHGETDLKNRAPEFRSESDHLGEINTTANITHTRWGVSTGVKYAITNSIELNAIPRAGNSALGDMEYGGGISLTGRF